MTTDEELEAIPLKRVLDQLIDSVTELSVRIERLNRILEARKV